MMDNNAMEDAILQDKVDAKNELQSYKSWTQEREPERKAHCGEQDIRFYQLEYQVTGGKCRTD